MIMSFNSMIPVEESDFYLEYAFRTAKRYASIKKQAVRGDQVKKAKNYEVALMSSVAKTLKEKLDNIIYSFPNFDNLSEFYEELVRINLDYVKLKESLGALNWAKNQMNTFANEYKKKLSTTGDIDKIKGIGKEFLGRISSIFRQIKKKMAYLEVVRLTMRDFPVINEESFTVALAGFPNVGKSTLLSKITDSTPEIKVYAFTTKKLNVGYCKDGVHKMQLIDTPGTLNRIDKMNQIERVAYLAIKYCADIVVFVYDLTEGYSLEDQEKLFKRVSEFDKPMLVYLSKADILPKKLVEDFAKKVDGISDAEVLRLKIIEQRRILLK